MRAIALALDPLFFFVPVIREDKKCISEDKKMWINAIFWRSVLDFIYLVQFAVVKEGVQCTNALNTNSVPEDETSAEGQREEKKEDASNTKSAKRQRYPWMCFMFAIIVILPIPQVRETSANL